MTDEQRSQLEHVNVALNATIKPVTDQAQYHVPEYWEAAEGAGDCEDYALAKRKALVALDWAPEDLNIGVCRLLKTGEVHAVLIAHVPGDGDYVLDNLRNNVERWDALRDYDWIMVSVKGSFKEWRAVT